MLDPARHLVEAQVRPLRDVPGHHDVFGVFGEQRGFAQDAVVDPEPGTAQPVGGGHAADREYHTARDHELVVGQMQAERVLGADPVPDFGVHREVDPVVGLHLGHGLGDPRPEAVQRRLGVPDERHVPAEIPHARRELAADEPTADHDSGLGTGHQRTAQRDRVLDRAQHPHPRVVPGRAAQVPRVHAGRDDQPVVPQLLAAGQIDDPLLGVQVGGPGAQPPVRVQLGVRLEPGVDRPDRAHH